MSRCEHVRSSRVAGAFIGWMVAARCLAGDVAQLNMTLVNGASKAIVPAGGTFNARVALDAPLATSCNGVLFRLVFTTESCQIIEYDWHAPFVTGGVTDFSLIGLSLPVTVLNETLVGAGYPIETADVEFGNFDFFQSTSGGPLVDLILRAPIDAKPGAVFFVVAVPDLLSDGFEAIPTDVGLVLTIEIANSGVFGDLSGDGQVNSQDLAILLGDWGSDGAGDLDGSGEVDATDLAILLGAWSA